MGSLISDIKMTNERNIQKFSTVIPRIYDVGSSATGNVFRDTVIEGYSRKSNVKSGMLFQDNLLGSRQNMCSYLWNNYKTTRNDKKMIFQGGGTSTMS
jgi:hypothetical protein